MFFPGAQVLLLSWNDAVSFDRGFQFLEVFSGQGNVSKKMHLSPQKACSYMRRELEHIMASKSLNLWGRHRLGYSVASIDFDYSNKHMDFLNVSGFLLLRRTHMFMPNLSNWYLKVHLFPTGGPLKLRLAIYVLMNMAPRGLTLWAPVCGSWGLPCRHTSGRSIINIAGNTCYQFVRDGNLMISRTLSKIYP